MRKKKKCIVCEKTVGVDCFKEDFKTCHKCSQQATKDDPNRLTEQQITEARRRLKLLKISKERKDFLAWVPKPGVVYKSGKAL